MQRLTQNQGGWFMKKQQLFPLLAVLVLLAAGSVQAQNGGVKANIPFDFTAGSKTLPAGEYRITAMSDAGGVLRVAGSGFSKGLSALRRLKKLQRRRAPAWRSTAMATGIS